MTLKVPRVTRITRIPYKDSLCAYTEPIGNRGNYGVTGNRQDERR